MANAVTMQQLQDASLDAETLKTFVNGDENTVNNPRLLPNVDIGSIAELRKKVQDKVDLQIATLPAGRKGYPTLAAAQAAQASLPANTIIEVTNDSDSTKNGVYTWNGTTLTKSTYDPLTQAKNYTNITTATLKENFIVDSTNEGIFFLSYDRVPLFYVLNDGSFHLCGDSKDLRDRVKHVDETENKVLYEFRDSNNELVAYLTTNGELFIIGNAKSIQQQINESNNTAYLSLKLNSILDSDCRAIFSLNVMDTQKDRPVNNLVTVEPFPNETGKVQRIGAALKLQNNKILYFWGGGVGSPYNGDGEGVKLYKRILTYTDGGQIFDKGTKTLFRATSDPAGIAKHPMLGRTQSGRIVLIWDERNTIYTPTNPYTTMISFSDDEGETFTNPIPIPNNPEFAFQVVGSTGTIITLSTGRLICPMYYTLPSTAMGMMYSDDNGITWQYGTALSLDGIALQEPSITFDEDDKIYVSSRTTAPNQMKHLSVSTDGGETLQDLGFHEQLKAPQVASSIYYDFENKMMFHSSPTGANRYKYMVQISADKAATWQFSHQPFPDSFYVGYTQIIKLSSNLYAVVVEGLQNSVSVNTSENVGLYIFNTKEVFNNVNRN